MAIVWITANDLDDSTNEYAEEVAKAASWILYKLTAEKYAGIRETTEWYGIPSATCQVCSAINSDLSFMSSSIAINQHVHLFRDSGLYRRELRLRGKPVRRISSVVAGSTVLASSDYKLANNAFIVKSDGTRWDMTQGVYVTYEYGNMPPAAGIRAAKTLGNELLLAISDPAKCQLPARVTSMTRQGYTFDMFDPREFLSSGRLGLFDVDMFIAAANPYGAKKRPRVFLPDQPHGERYN